MAANIPWSSLWDGCHITLPYGFRPFQFKSHWLTPSSQENLRNCQRYLSSPTSSGSLFKMALEQFFHEVFNNMVLNRHWNIITDREMMEFFTHAIQSILFCHQKGFEPDHKILLQLFKKRAEIQMHQNPCEAVEDLLMVKKLAPTDVTSRIMMCELYSITEQWNKCFHEIFHLFRDLRVKLNFDDFERAVLHLVQSLVEMKDVVNVFKGFRPHDVEYHWTDNSDIWKVIVRRLCEKKLFDGLGIITVGMCDNLAGVQKPGFQVFKGAAIPGVKYDLVNIGAILCRLYKKGIKKWHLKMAEFFIQRNADIRDIERKFNEPLLNVMTMLSLDAETPSFLELVWVKLSPKEFCDDGRQTETTLHFLAKRIADKENKHLIKTAEILCRRLLENVYVAFQRDCHGKQPHELLPEYLELHKMMKKAVTEPYKGIENYRMKLLTLADEKRKNQEYKYSVTLYEEAINIYKPYDTFDTDAKIFLKMAIAYFKLKNYEKSLEAVIQCFNIESHFNMVTGKTYFWYAVASEKCGKLTLAFQIYLDGYAFQETDKDRHLMLSGGIKLIPELEEVCLKQVVRDIVLFEWEPCWEDVIRIISNSPKMWETLKVMFLGPPYLNKAEGIKDQQALFWHMPVKGINLYSIWNVIDYVHIQAPRLIHVLILKGADFTTLSSDRKEALHAVVRFSAITDDTGVLRYVLKNLSRGSSVNDLDSNRRTPLHTLCLIKNKNVEDKTLIDVAKVLCDAGCDMSLRDSDAKTATDYAGGKLQEWIKTRQGGGQSSKPSTTQSAGQLNLAEWHNLKDSGNQEYKKGNYSGALQIYKHLLVLLESLSCQDVTNHERAIVFGNVAECLIRFNDLAGAHEAASQSLLMDDQWYKAHLRYGRISKLGGASNEGVFNIYMKSLDCIKKDLNEEDNWFNVLSYLFERDLTDFEYGCLWAIRRDADFWASTVYKFISKDSRPNWIKAKRVFRMVKNRLGKKHTVDFSHFCKPDDSIIHCEFVLDFISLHMDAGTDLSSLKFWPSDTALHAAISIIVLGDISSKDLKKREEENHFLIHMIQNAKKLYGQNVVDETGNSPLHHIAYFASLKDYPEFQDKCKFVASMLIEQNFNVMATNKDGKLAVDLCGEEDEVRRILEKAMDLSRKEFRQETQRVDQSPHSAPPRNHKAASATSVLKETTCQSAKKKQSQQCKNCEDLIKRATAAKTDRNYPLMYMNLVTVINEKKHRKDTRHEDFKNECVETIVNVLCSKRRPDFPVSLMKISVDGLKDVIKLLIERKKWSQMKAVISHFKSSNPEILSFLQDQLPLKKVLSVEDFCNKEDDRLSLAEYLLENGAELKPASSGQLVKHAMELNELKVVLMLLKKGADPSGVSFTEGDTPLHAALRIALIENKGNFDVFDELTSKERKDQPYFNWACQDTDGNTLLHVAAKVKWSNPAMRAIERLCQNQVPATVKNKDGKLPIQYLTNSKDRRRDYLRTKTNAAELEKRNEISGEKDSMQAESATNVKKGKSTEPQTKIFSSHKCKQEIREILDSLPDYEINLVPIDDDQEMSGGNGEERDEESEEEDEEIVLNMNLDWSDEEGDVGATEPGSNETSIELQDKDNIVINSEDIVINSETFDNLPWEVECTEDVWNLLKGKKKSKNKRQGEKDKVSNIGKDEISDALKKVIIIQIQQLARGDWSTAKPIDMQEETLQLFRLKLMKGTFILFELAVTFSSKLKDSNQSEDNMCHPYSDIIRIWNIATTLSEAKKMLQKILISHQRGKECFVKNNLLTTELHKSLATSSDTRYPKHYNETQVTDLTCPKNSDEEQFTYCPPASTGKMEFHILKFYSFSSNLVTAVIDNAEIEVDFPFKVTPLEHTIITLPSTSPILLLGRSGTGKTTICVYRLWKKFMEYWELEQHHHQPLLTRNRPAIKADEAEPKGFQSEEPPETSTSNQGGDIEVEGTEMRLDDREIQLAALAYESKWMVTTEEDDEMGDDDSGKDEENNDDYYCGASNVLDDDSKDDKAENDEESQRDVKSMRPEYNHLHQLFVTKNQQLCCEVGMSFQRLRNSVQFLKGHSRFDKDPLPYTLQAVDEEAFPLFVTSRQILLMLDASLEGEEFFDRDEDRALKNIIPGWGGQEYIFHNIPLEDSSDEDAEDDERKDKGAVGGKDVGGSRRKYVQDYESAGGLAKRRDDPRRECTYDVFAHEVWRKIAKKSGNAYHPSLVWTEIMSFIKGSHEALHSENGYLDLESYEQVGQKAAPNFCGKRSEIYAIFLNYQKLKREKRLFDEADLVFNIYKRLRETPYCEWIFHEIYVDELQDFTQAELSLLIALSHDPNKMFLTGDTAQSIMHGISFRFKDVQSLFYFAKKAQNKRDKSIQSIKPPDKVHPLKYNYRSHSGILSLASSVLDLLTNFFPESYDVMDRDQGLFDGPRPVLIEFCSQTELALLLSGNQRKTSHIEFGAHQAILVVNQQAKDNIPDDLKTAIVLTVYESKGLEFDDVLLYNFFKDSQASEKNEWRVVTQFLNSLADSKRNNGQQDDIDFALLQEPGRPHPLTFNPTMHKILNTELKHLYTALTRARVNVWIFDEDENKSAPVFEYFKALKLVKVMEQVDGQNNFGDQFFVKKSSTKAWYSQGMMFLSKKRYEPAAKCFRWAQNTKMEMFATAHHLYQKATQEKQPKLLLEAANNFVKCESLDKAASCLSKARDHNLSALAYEKNGQMKEAASQYLRMSQFIEASQCFESAGMFDRAIDVLVGFKAFERALDCLHRYEILRKDFPEEKVFPQILIDHRPKDSHSKEHLLYRLAGDYLNKQEEENMFQTIDRMNDLEDQYQFLASKGYNKRAAEILERMDRTEDAAHLMLKGGQFVEGLEYARKGDHQHLEASIHLTMARVQLAGEKESPSKEARLEDIEENAFDALELFQKSGDENGKGQALIVLGCVKKSKDYLNKAAQSFKKAHPPNLAGRIEAFYLQCSMQESSQLMDLTKCKIWMDMVINGIEVMKILRNPTKEEADRHLAYLSFYGLESTPGSDQISWNPSHNPMCLKRLPNNSQKDDKQRIQMEKAEVVENIWNTLQTDLTSSVSEIQKSLADLISHRKGYKTEGDVLHAIDMLCLKVELDWLVQTKQSFFEIESLSELLSWDSAQSLIEYLPPVDTRLQLFDLRVNRKVIKKISSSEAVKSQLNRYLLHKWDNPNRVAEGKTNKLTKERAKGSDWLIQACFLKSLFKLDINVEGKAEELEVDIQKLNHDWFAKSYKYALVVIKNETGAISAVECLGGKFIKSFQLLVGTKESSPDPYEAVFKFTKLISIFAHRGVTCILPGTDHLLFWLEFYCSLTFCFIGKARQKRDDSSFYLPVSYLNHFDIINLCKKSHSDSLLIDVVKHNSNKYNLDRRILDRQQFIINFMIGHSRYSKFSLLKWVPEFLRNADDIRMAERMIILALVLLLNTCSGFVHSHNVSRLRGALLSVLKEIRHSKKTPNSITRLLSPLSAMSSPTQIFSHLSSFLQEHRHEAMVACQWSDQMAPPLQKKTMEPSTIETQSFSTEPQDNDNVNNLSWTEEEEGVETEYDVSEEAEEEVDEVERFEMEKEAMQKQLALEEKKDKSVKIIVRFYRRCVEKFTLEEKPYHEFEENYLFAPYVLSDERCGLCGVDFAGDITEEGMERTSDEESKSRKAHERNERHLKNLEDYSMLRQNYYSKVLKKRQEICGFVDKYQVKEDSIVYKNVTKDVKKLTSYLSNFNTHFNELLMKRDWKGHVRITVSFSFLEATFDKCKNMIMREYEEHHAKNEHMDAGPRATVEDGLEDYPTSPVGPDPYLEYNHRQGRGQGSGQGRGQGSGQGRGQGRSHGRGRGRGRGHRGW